MALTAAEQKAWLDQVQEEIIDPERPIVDPHHHMWRSRSRTRYLLEDLWADTESGHNVVKTVFIECRSEYRVDGPEHLRPVGETEFMTRIAKASRGQGRAEISGIVAYTDLAQDVSIVREVCEAHRDASAPQPVPSAPPVARPRSSTMEQPSLVAGAPWRRLFHASDGLFRGIRHGGAYDPDKPSRWGDPATLPDLYTRQDFRKGVALLGEMGLVYDTWHYHYQNRAFADLARSTAGTVIVLNHFGSPIGTGRFADKRAQVFAKWKRDMVELAACENVMMKIGGLAMPSSGFDWHLRETPATSDEVVAAQRDYYLFAIDCFGPDRCMFESNFPADKLSLSYHVYWNAMKKIAAGFSESEKDMLFSGTATRVYKL